MATMAMHPKTLLDAARSVNLATLRLALRNRETARAYWSQSVQRYNELMDRGLRNRSPVDFLFAEGWAQESPDARCELPIVRRDGGGTLPAESIVLGAVTRLLRPRRIFEIGTFVGKTTSIFILNAPPDADVITLDLPPDADVDAGHYIDTDVQLVKQRRLARMVHDLGLTDRCQQILIDSMAFDPAPYAGSVDLAFIDGAHSGPYVINDTNKVAVMMAERGLVLWHDYGGQGRFRDLTGYLDRLGRGGGLFRMPGTTLAWSTAAALREALA